MLFLHNSKHIKSKKYMFELSKSIAAEMMKILPSMYILPLYSQEPAGVVVKRGVGVTRGLIKTRGFVVATRGTVIDVTACSPSVTSTNTYNDIFVPVVLSTKSQSDVKQSLVE